MDGGKKVWAPHATDGFKQGRIVDLGADAITVEPFDSPGQVRKYKNLKKKTQKTKEKSHKIQC